MKKLSLWQNISVVILSAALLAAFFINPLLVGAINTSSLHLNSTLDQHTYAPDSSSLSITGDMTAEAWVKFDSLPSTGGAFTIAAKWNNLVNHNSWLLHYDNGNSVIGGNALMFMWDGDGQNDGGQGRCYTPWVPTIGTWYHVAVAFEGVDGGTCSLYINGATQTVSYDLHDSDTIFDSNEPTGIGATRSNNSPYLFFNGKIDDVRIWNTARSQSQVATNMSQELAGNESGLVAYWQLNSTLSDQTANGNTLTPVNSPLFSSDTPFPVVVPFTEVRKVRKTSNESVTSSNALQNDDQLKLALKANTTYVIDGVIFASATNGTPDLKVSLGGVSGTVATIGYTNDATEEVLGNNSTSGRIAVGTTPKSIHIHGTVVTGATNGDFQLKWAQNTSNSHPTSVLLGSYLRAEEI